VNAGAEAQGGHVSPPQLDWLIKQRLTAPRPDLPELPAATQPLLEVPYAGIVDWLPDQVEAGSSMQERTAFVTGEGMNKPKGFPSCDMHDRGQAGCALCAMHMR
jgi:predicted phage gp36 major capsid-like protein